MGTRKRRAENAEDPTIDITRLPVPNDANEHLLQIPDSTRAMISLTGKAFERALLAKLDWPTYMQAPFPAYLPTHHTNRLHQTEK